MDPLLDGADQLTSALELPGTADTEVGGPGTPVGVTAGEGWEGRLVPKLVVAVTVNV
jgi:hypothetical protein